MSKLDVGVGEEFPLDEGGNDSDERQAWKQDHRARKRAFRAEHHHGHHHRHGPVHLPLFLVFAGIAGLIAAGKIPVMAAYMMLALAVAAVLFLFVVHAHHRCWNGDHGQRTQ